MRLFTRMQKKLAFIGNNNMLALNYKKISLRLIEANMKMENLTPQVHSNNSDKRKALQAAFITSTFLTL